ncbi:hypothetical protein K1719_006526 [Acacia pycnantha]|nr:hypothetical protein K1719_006526 [Acacia pycnantha]
MGYGLHLPRTSEVGNQVHQDDPVNEAVRDAFGVQDDNFTAEVQGPDLFSSGTMQLGNFSASWMRAIVLCIKASTSRAVFALPLVQLLGLRVPTLDLPALASQPLRVTSPPLADSFLYQINLADEAYVIDYAVKWVGIKG